MGMPYKHKTCNGGPVARMYQQGDSMVAYGKPRMVPGEGAFLYCFRCLADVPPGEVVDATAADILLAIMPTLDE